MENINIFSIGGVVFLVGIGMVSIPPLLFVTYLIFQFLTKSEVRDSFHDELFRFSRENEDKFFFGMLKFPPRPIKGLSTWMLDHSIVIFVIMLIGLVLTAIGTEIS